MYIHIKLTEIIEEENTRIAFVLVFIYFNYMSVLSFFEILIISHVIELIVERGLFLVRITDY